MTLWFAYSAGPEDVSDSQGDGMSPSCSVSAGTAGPDQAVTVVTRRPTDGPFISVSSHASTEERRHQGRSPIGFDPEEATFLRRTLASLARTTLSWKGRIPSPAPPVATSPRGRS
jgi:hypothetical protein